MGLHRQQVSRYLSKSKARSNHDITERISEYKTDQLDKLGYILAESLKAWGWKIDDNAKPNPKYLTEARGALKDIRELLGLNAQVETHTTIDIAQVVAELEAKKAAKGTDAQE